MNSEVLGSLNVIINEVQSFDISSLFSSSSLFLSQSSMLNSIMPKCAGQRWSGPLSASLLQHWAYWAHLDVGCGWRLLLRRRA